MKKKQPKYKNTKVIFDGIKFDSKLELKRYKQLLLSVNRGAIKDLELQPKFLLSDTLKVIKNGKKETYCKNSYIADFAYKKHGLYIVEDVKGVETTVYKFKRKLFLEKGYCDLFREVKNRETIEYKKDT